MTRLPAAMLAALVTVAGVGLAPAPPTAAQECAAEVEPNEMPEAAISLSAPGCASGSLAEEADLADLFLWAIGPDEAAQRWSVAVTSSSGLPAVLTLTSVAPDPATVTLGTVIASIRAEAANALVTTPELLLAPGRYLVSVTPGAPWSGSPTSYRFDMEPGTAMPPSADQEPNDEPAAAVPLEGAFELSGDAAGSLDHFAWQVEELPTPGLSSRR